MVFILSNPLRDDLRYGTSFFSEPPDHTSDSLELLFDALYPLELDRKCYFMYAFPFEIPRKEPPTDAELHLFLPFASRRLEILRPTVVVALSVACAKYFFSSMKPHALSESRVPPIERALEEAKPEKNVRIGAIEVMGLHCPNPFRVLKDATGLGKMRKMWDACFVRVGEISNPHRVRGPKMFFENVGEERVAAFPVMKIAQVAFWNEPPIKPRKAPQKKGLGSKPGRGQPTIGFFMKKRHLEAEEDESTPAIKKQSLFIPNIHP